MEKLKHSIRTVTLIEHSGIYQCISQPDRPYEASKYEIYIYNIVLHGSLHNWMNI